MIFNFYVSSHINLIFHSEISFPGVSERSVIRNQIRLPTSLENGVRHHSDDQLYV